MRRSRHKMSDELKQAVVEYYMAMGQYVNKCHMRLIEYRWHGNLLSDILVRFTDASGKKVATICSYNGRDGQSDGNSHGFQVTERDWCELTTPDCLGCFVDGYVEFMEQDNDEDIEEAIIRGEYDEERSDRPWAD